MSHVVAVRYTRGSTTPRQCLDNPPIVAVYVPVRTPVQAVQYQTVGNLDDIAVWIRHLYRYGLNPAITFSTAERGTITVGLLHQPGAGLVPVEPGDFVVYDLRTLIVQRPDEFRALYQPLTTIAD
jgi:hypothetical protein